MVGIVSGENVVTDSTGRRAIEVIDWCLHFIIQPPGLGRYPGVQTWVEQQPLGWVRCYVKIIQSNTNKSNTNCTISLRVIRLSAIYFNIILLPT